MALLEKQGKLDEAEPEEMHTEFRDETAEILSCCDEAEVCSCCDWCACDLQQLRFNRANRPSFSEKLKSKAIMWIPALSGPLSMVVSIIFMIVMIPKLSYRDTEMFDAVNNLRDCMNELGLKHICNKSAVKYVIGRAHINPIDLMALQALDCVCVYTTVTHLGNTSVANSCLIHCTSKTEHTPSSPSRLCLTAFARVYLWQ